MSRYSSMASSNITSQVPRRSYSLPVAKATATQNEDIEVLYTLPSVRIIAFTTSSPTSRPGSSNDSVSTAELGTSLLSWESRFERTIAVGAFCIYRAPGSVAFLRCQNALRPILPKSQAWCVDGDSKFVLQVRPPQYWRIEVPNKTPDEVARVEVLKSVFGQVLRFEKTPCPFQRNFTVELPKEPETPIRKKAWKPVDRPKLETSSLSEKKSMEGISIESAGVEARRNSASPSPYRRPVRDPLRVETLIAALEERSPKTQRVLQEVDVSPCRSPIGFSDNESSLDLNSHGMITNNVTETPLEEHFEEPLIARMNCETVPTSDEESDGFSDATDVTVTKYLNPTPPTTEPENDKLNKSRGLTHSPMLASSGFNLPLKERSTSHSPLRCSTTISNGPGSDASSSVESFHSLQSWHSPLTPPSPPASAPSSPISSYPYPHENIVLPKRVELSRDISAMALTPETPQHWGEAENLNAVLLAAPAGFGASEVDDGRERREDKENSTEITIRPTIRHRTTTSSNSHLRELSPLPPAETLFSPRKKRRPRKLQTARYLPTAIIQKTYEILISPPSHLFQMMLNIASRIAAGEWRGILSSNGESVSWDFQDEYGEDQDDYGFSISNQSSKSKKFSSGVTVGSSGEVD